MGMSCKSETRRMAGLHYRSPAVGFCKSPTPQLTARSGARKREEPGSHAVVLRLFVSPRSETITRGEWGSSRVLNSRWRNSFLNPLRLFPEGSLVVLVRGSRTRHPSAPASSLPAPADTHGRFLRHSICSSRIQGYVSRMASPPAGEA